jgi:signal transduction histidine kinase
MHFKVTARTILQLGAELISSDAIAFYELIKNAFDAGSRKVEVRVVLRLPQSVIADATDTLATTSKLLPPAKAQLLQRLIQSVDLEAPEALDFKQALERGPSKAELADLLKKANYILIKDQGEGMSLHDLEDIYLTIGTRNRRKQRDLTTTDVSAEDAMRPILGEKGLGRLSVMRLGEGLVVETTRADELYYNLLEIDWTAFSHDSDALLESITVEPRQGRLKDKPSAQGTSIRIYDLRAVWSKDKVEEISREQLSRFIDPFSRTNRDFIALWFNKQPIILTGIDKILFNNAHAFVKSELVFDAAGTPSLIGEIHYKTYDRHKTFTLTGTHLATVIKADNPTELLRSLGPFSAELHWYNRQLLTKSAGVVDAKYIKELVATWGGGLMVYRDGFRVNPYGGPNDDWLNLDPTALASPGYKLNRRQVVGKVDITSRGNPALLDQTNREGLRDNPEKQALISLLQYFIWKELKLFLDAIKEDEQANLAALSLGEIEKRIYLGQHKVREALKYLTNTYPALREETEVITTIEDVLAESAALFKSAKASAQVLEERLSTTINLAGLGLMIDVIAHELNRATQHAIQTINGMTSQELPQRTASSMSTLRAQLKTLQTRLKVLDPLGPSGRQHKTLVDLNTLLRETFRHHQAQFERHHIQLVMEDDKDLQEWKIQAVPGMIIQVLENLISNAVYWLKQEQIINKLSNAQIRVKVDRSRKLVLFSDNGPGIPIAKKEDVFRPFVSTKPPGEGKGLGLYISREIAQYHGAALYLQAEVGPTDTVLHTFVLDLQNAQ